MNSSLIYAPTAALLLIAPPLVAFLLGCAGGRPAPAPVLPAPQAASAPPAPSPGFESEIRAALTGSARTDRERARDGARHPAETLAFFGLRDDATVVELWPGGGYYTAILAPVLSARGKLVVTHFDPAGDPKSDDTQEAQQILDRLAKTPAVFARVSRQQIAASRIALGPEGSADSAPPQIALGPDASADFVLTFRNVHNWIVAGYAENVFAAAARVLKPGGVLGVEEHRAAPGTAKKEIAQTGYVPEEVVVRLATAAGLRLAGRSEINANPRDTKDYRGGVWSLPPTFAEKDVNREKYAAIGESDRMTLKFVKP